MCVSVCEVLVCVYRREEAEGGGARGTESKQEHHLTQGCGEKTGRNHPFSNHHALQRFPSLKSLGQI